MKETILVLVSDSVIGKVICKALESKGYCVLMASDTGGAAALLKECTPDLLIVRPYTESMSGHDAAVYLRRRCPGIPVLIVGGFLDDVSLENREFLQRFEIFPKPFRAAELLDKVAEMLINRSLHERAKRNSQ